MAFPALAEPASPPLPLQADRRIMVRYEVCVPVEVTTADGVPLSTSMTNISSSGFRARSPMLLAKGEKLIVRFNGRLPRRAQVAWQNGEEIGCRFLKPLSREQLSQAAGL